MFKKDKKEFNKEEYLDIVLEDFIKIDTCCDCDIYAQIIQRFDYNYSVNLVKRKLCDNHMRLLKQKYMDKVGKSIGD